MRSKVLIIDRFVLLIAFDPERCMFMASRVDLKTRRLNSMTARLLKLLHNTECCCIMRRHDRSDDFQSATLHLVLIEI